MCWSRTEEIFGSSLDAAIRIIALSGAELHELAPSLCQLISKCALRRRHLDLLILAGKRLLHGSVPNGSCLAVIGPIRWLLALCRPSKVSASFVAYEITDGSSS
jgi:hypothetical protein